MRINNVQEVGVFLINSEVSLYNTDRTNPDVLGRVVTFKDLRHKFMLNFHRGTDSHLWAVLACIACSHCVRANVKNQSPNFI